MSDISDKEKRNQRKREWYAKNKDKVKASNMRYWEKKLAAVAASKQAGTTDIKTMSNYCLYAVLLTQIKASQLNAREYSYVGFGRKYALIYSKEELQAPYVAIPEETKLEPDERQFVVGCKLQINAKYMRENESELADGLDELLTALETELKAEQDKVGEKKNV